MPPPGTHGVPKMISANLVQPFDQWPNLKNLSGGLNLSRGLNMVSST